MFKNFLFASAALLLFVPEAAQSQASAAPGLFATRYDAGGRVAGTIGPDPDGAGSLKYPATRTTYDAFGNVSKVETGELAAWQSEDISPANWAGFSIKSTTEFGYDDLGRKTSELIAGGTDDKQLTQYTYNYLSQGREVCVAVRMNRDVFATLLASTTTTACDLGSQGADGPDRITRTEYDYLDRVSRIRMAMGTDREQTYASYSYSGGSSSISDSITRFGRPYTVTDAKGNVTSYAYSGPYQLVSDTYFPSATSVGTWNTSDYEHYEYDENANRTSLRRRDGRTLGFHYDALNRLDIKTVPDGCSPLLTTSCIPASATRDVYYGYDLVGNRLFARFDSVSASSEGVTDDYNGLGELQSSTISMSGLTRTLSYQYDPHGNRTHLVFPDSVDITTGYDGLDRVNSATWSSPSVTASTFETISYNASGLREKIQRGSSSTSYQYNAALLLKTQTQNFFDDYGNVELSFDYNADGQIKKRYVDNNAYEFLAQAGPTRIYERNGLNQYTTVGGAAFQYDLAGNLTYDNVSTYAYDAENRLISTDSGVTLVYDPLGRLFQIGGGGAATTRFLYDGNDLVGEYDTSGALNRRYVFGPNVDEPVAVIQGSALACGSATFFHADRQGSIVAHANCSGVRTAVNTYDEYGYPGSANQGRFRYTGQVWLSEIASYYYKARMYSPTLGRFLQTDPTGYDDGLNWYAYVSNDPLNKSDPTGTEMGPAYKHDWVQGGGVPSWSAQDSKLLMSQPAMRIGLGGLAAYGCAALPSACQKLAIGAGSGALVSGGFSYAEGHSTSQALADARKGAVSGVATSAAALATGGKSRVTKAIAVGTASATTSKLQGGNNFDAGLAGTVSGGMEFLTGNAEISNAFGLGFQGALGDISKSLVKKVIGGFVKEDAKAVCQKANSGQKC